MKKSRRTPRDCRRLPEVDPRSGSSGLRRVHGRLRRHRTLHQLGLGRRQREDHHLRPPVLPDDRRSQRERWRLVARVRGGRREDRQDDCEHLAQAMCSAAEHHPRCWAALCLTLGPLVSPKTVWMPIRQRTVMRPGLRLSTSQKKEEPSRVFPKPRHHAIAVLLATWCRNRSSPAKRCRRRSQHDA